MENLLTWPWQLSDYMCCSTTSLREFDLSPPIETVIAQWLRSHLIRYRHNEVRVILTPPGLAVLVSHDPTNPHTCDETYRWYSMIASGSAILVLRRPSQRTNASPGGTSSLDILCRWHTEVSLRTFRVVGSVVSCHLLGCELQHKRRCSGGGRDAGRAECNGLVRQYLEL